MSIEAGKFLVVYDFVNLDNFCSINCLILLNWKIIVFHVDVLVLSIIFLGI